MKALILAAGLGTRLKPITERIPKVLVQIGGKPLLEYHLEQLDKYDIKEVLINTHHLADKVKDYCRDYSKTKIGQKIVLVHEEMLLGTAGTLLKNQSFFEGEADILVIYGDNFTNIDYGDLINYHKQEKSPATIVCQQVENIQQKGMIVLDTNNRIDRFKEKPEAKEIVSNYANCGIYVFTKAIFDHLKPLHQKDRALDFGHDVFPSLLEKKIAMLVYKLKGRLIDIGNPTSYTEANDIMNNQKQNL
jgi:NDP-sugar pyrophosphorylase family protein